MTDKTLTYHYAEYRDGSGFSYPAIEASLKDIDALLGHPYDGDPQDDYAIIQALLNTGAPRWLYETQGYLEDGQWGLFYSPVPHSDPPPTYPWYIDYATGERFSLSGGGELTAEARDSGWLPG